MSRRPLGRCMMEGIFAGIGHLERFHYIVGATLVSADL
jgi:hypothetical protein